MGIKYKYLLAGRQQCCPYPANTYLNMLINAYANKSIIFIRQPREIMSTMQISACFTTVQLQYDTNINQMHYFCMSSVSKSKLNLKLLDTILSNSTFKSFYLSNDQKTLFLYSYQTFCMLNPQFKWFTCIVLVYLTDYCLVCTNWLSSNQNLYGLLVCSVLHSCLALMLL